MTTNKIIKFSDLRQLRKKNQKSKIILAHGTFDLFHYGHLKHLEKSKKKLIYWLYPLQLISM